MTDWLKEATVSLDKAMAQWEELEWMEGLPGGARCSTEKRVRCALLIAYEEGLNNANRQHKEKNA